MSKNDSSPASEVQLEEMLRRLKEPKSGSGEVIVREDGSQVIRQKRKKRRSSQPKKEAKEKARKQFIRRTIITAAISLVVLTVSGALLTHYNSKGFRETVEERTEDLTGYTTELEKLSIRPFTLSSPSAQLDDGRLPFIEKIKLNKVEAQLDPLYFLIGRLRGDTLTARSGKLDLSLSKLEQESEVAEGIGSPFAHFECRRTHIQFGEGPGSFLKVEDLALLLYPNEDGDELRLRKGSLTVSQLGAFPINTGTLAVAAQQLNVIGLRLGTPSGQGSVELVGQVSLDPAEESQLTAQLKDAHFSDLTSAALGQFLDGRFSSSEALITIPSLEKANQLEMVIPFKNGQVSLGKLPFALGLSELVGTASGRPEFRDKVEGRIRRTLNSIRIENLNLQELNTMVLKGELDVDDQGNLSGQLELGVSERILVDSNGQLKLQGFSEPRNGYHYMDLKLSGTVDEPLDNYSSQISSGLSPAALEPAVEVPQTFEQLLDGF